MKFKKNFLIFSSAWAVFITVLSDVLLISSMRSLSTDADRPGSFVFLILVPTLTAALCLMLITAFSWRVIRRQRRHYLSIEGHGQYAFFRNWVCVLAAGAVINSVLLCNRFASVFGILRTEEDKRIHQLFHDKPELMHSRLSLLDDRISAYGNTALVMTVLLALTKAAAYLFTARTLVRAYHKHAATAYASSHTKTN